jgi:hypothetical protein
MPTGRRCGTGRDGAKACRLKLLARCINMVRSQRELQERVVIIRAVGFAQEIAKGVSFFFSSFLSEL